MLKQSLKAFKLFQHRFNILSTRFNNVERGWQTLSTLPFNKIERMLKQMLKPFARAFKLELNTMSEKSKTNDNNNKSYKMFAVSKIIFSPFKPNNPIDRYTKTVISTKYTKHDSFHFPSKFSHKLFFSTKEKKIHFKITWSNRQLENKHKMAKLQRVKLKQPLLFLSFFDYLTYLINMNPKPLM